MILATEALLSGKWLGLTYRRVHVIADLCSKKKKKNKKKTTKM